MLGRRYASRGREDEIVIWSLLCGESAQKTVEDFWMCEERLNSILMQGSTKILPARHIATGFLVSSAPRITERYGLGWAPCQPSIPYKSVGFVHQAFDVYDGLDTMTGTYTNRGLEAHWLVHEFSGLGWVFNIRLKKWFAALSGQQTPCQLGEIVLNWLSRFRRGAIIIPAFHSYHWTTSLMTDVSRLMTVTEDGSRRHAVVMVRSNDGEHWNWLGVQELDHQVIKSLESVKQK